MPHTEKLSEESQTKLNDINALIESFDYIEDLELAELAEKLDETPIVETDPIGIATVELHFAFAKLCRATIDNG